MNLGRFLVAILLFAMMPLTIYSVVVSTTSSDQLTPMIRRSGFVNMTYVGVFHHQIVQPYEDVFYLETKQGPVRLIFFCGSEGSVIEGSVQLSDRPLRFCTSVSQLNLTEGQRVIVRGTVVEPSQWFPERSSPRLVFVADFYVIAVAIPNN